MWQGTLIRASNGVFLATKTMKKTTNEEKVIKSVKVSTYYNDFVVKLDKKYRKLPPGGSAVCPLHDENDPSFSDWSDKGLFHCFGCGSTGDVITLHQRLQNRHYGKGMTREKAMEGLALLYGVELEKNEKGEVLVESPFAKARRKMGIGVERESAGEKGVTLSEFRKYNDQVKRNERLKDSVKALNYQKLDMMMAASLQERKEEN